MVHENKLNQLNLLNPRALDLLNLLDLLDLCSRSIAWVLVYLHICSITQSLDHSSIPDRSPHRAHLCQPRSVHNVTPHPRSRVFSMQQITACCL
jgi:hypothetical protein